MPTLTAAELATLNAGGSITLSPPAAVVTPPPPPPPPTKAKVKWNPGLFMMSVDINNSTAGEMHEIDVLAAGMAANPQLKGIITGYALYRDWKTLQPSAKGVYDFTSIDTTNAYLQSKLPGFSLDIQVRPYANWLSAFSATAGESILPAYLYNGDPLTYGQASKGGQGAAWGLVNYTAATQKYAYVAAALWNPNVMAEWTALFGALERKYGANPLIEGYKDFGPSEMMNFTGCPTTPPDFNGGQLATNWLNRCAALRAVTPNTLMGLMPGYLPSGWAMATLYPIVKEMAAQGIAISCTDVLWHKTGQDLTYAQNMLIGNIDYPAAGQNVWKPGGPVLTGTTSSWPTVQPEDWEAGAPTPDSAAQVTGVLGVCYNTLKADHVSLALASEFTFDPATDFYNPTTKKNGYIIEGILAAGGIPAANRPVPTAYT